MKIQTTITLDSKDVKALKDVVYILNRLDNAGDSRLWSTSDIKKIAYGEKLDNLQTTILYDL